MNKRIDKDVLAIERCVKALNQSSSPQTLRAALYFLFDYFLIHPSRELPEHLRAAERGAPGAAKNAPYTGLPGRTGPHRGEAWQ